MPAPSVTIAVPVLNRRERMLRCLDSLLAIDYPDYEVLVLDNGSTDGTADACRERARDASVPVRVEVLEGPVGLIRNRAADLSDRDLLAFTDSDCMVDPGWLRAGVEPFGDPAIGLVQGMTLPEPDVEHGRWFATLEVTAYGGRFESCNLLVRREAFRKSDGFDEEIGYFFEDTAAGWAMLREGWRPAFTTSALVYHDVTHPGWRWQLRRTQRYGNAAAVIRRYPELRRELLWWRLFVMPTNIKLVAALLGLGLSRRDRRALALALPYAWARRPASVGHYELTVGLIGNIALDLALEVGMLRGSLRHRTLVL
jgi:mycofactocin glycosyltransferase